MFGGQKLGADTHNRLCPRHRHLPSPRLQPALLYLSPAGLLFSLVPSLLRGEFRALTAYSDDKDEGKEKGGDKDSGDKKGTGDGAEEDEDKDSTKTTAVNGDSADKDSGLRKRVPASH